MNSADKNQRYSTQMIRAIMEVSSQFMTYNETFSESPFDMEKIENRAIFALLRENERLQGKLDRARLFIIILVVSQLLALTGDILQWMGT